MLSDIGRFLKNAVCNYAIDELIFLSSPLDHPDPKVRAERVKEILKIAAELGERGYTVITPVGYTVELQKIADFKYGWYDWCLRLLKRCDVLWIVKMNGWEESLGMKLEIAFAKGKGMTIREFDPYADPDEDTPF